MFVPEFPKNLSDLEPHLYIDSKTCKTCFIVLEFFPSPSGLGSPFQEFSKSPSPSIIDAEYFSNPSYFKFLLPTFPRLQELV
jgi:hypothetical protein